jgi:hypothetical protein
VHLSNLNLNHFKMVEAMGLKLSHRGPLPTRFHKNLPIGSKVDGGQTDTQRQDGDLIRLISFLESRLKRGTAHLPIMDALRQDNPPPPQVVEASTKSITSLWVQLPHIHPSIQPKFFS